MVFINYKINEKKKIIQSAVALVFRLKQIPLDQSQQMKQLQIKYHYSGHNLISDSASLNLILTSELLFIQRASSDKDVHSGQIALPGGKCELVENDFDASIRETFEEVGLDLRQLETFYYGRLHPNYQVRKTRMKCGQLGYLYCSAHVFLIVDKNNLTDNLKIQEAEIQQYKWISTQEIIKADNLNQKKITYLSDHYAMYFPGPLNFLWKQLISNYRYALVPQIDIKMDQQLWGLSFYIVASFFFLSQYSSKQIQQESQRLRTIAQVFEVNIDNNFAFSGPLSWLLKFSYRQNRINPTLYPSPNYHKTLYIILILIIVFIVSYL